MVSPSAGRDSNLLRNIDGGAAGILDRDALHETASHSELFLCDTAAVSRIGRDHGVAARRKINTLLVAASRRIRHGGTGNRFGLFLPAVRSGYPVQPSAQRLRASLRLHHSDGKQCHAAADIQHLLPRQPADSQRDTDRDCAERQKEPGRSGRSDGPEHYFVFVGLGQGFSSSS